MREDGKRASQQDPNGMITIVETDGKVKIPPSNKRGYLNFISWAIIINRTYVFMILGYLDYFSCLTHWVFMLQQQVTTQKERMEHTHKAKCSSIQPECFIGVQVEAWKVV